MLELIEPILTRVGAGERVALCVLVRARGSTPQADGAAMLVLADGRTLGTLGGGCVEAECRSRAVGAIDADTPGQLASFKLDHDFGYDDGLMCGGMMDVAIRVLSSDADVAPLVALRETLSSKVQATYEVDVPDDAGVPQSYAIAVAPTPTLIVAGAGHVGQAVAALARTLDFDVVVVDDRADVLTVERFPSARRVVGTIDLELKRWPVDAWTYVVIVTRGHRNDAAALAAVVDSPAAYIGMIGSTRKVRTILDGLAREGVDRERLFAVRAPIGLEIGAVTPGEIAVSVCAELIAVRRRHVGTAHPLQIDRGSLERWLDR